MTRLRLCPTVDGKSSPLITHLIGVDLCMSRQRGFYHKCHACQYRGQPAAFELPLPAELNGMAAGLRNGSSPAAKDIPADRAAAGSPAR